MSAPRLHSPSPLVRAGGRLELGQSAARHAHVLRLAAGDPLVVFDAEGRQAHARVVSLEPTSLSVELGAITQHAPDAYGPVLVQCVPKGSKLDDVVRAATEAGASAIHLALASRSIARAEGRLDRLARIAEEAARQSEAPRVPAIHAPASLREVASRAPRTSARVLLSPRAGARLREVIRADAATPPWLVVGPEGGLDDAETDSLLASGYVLGRLDTYVLRTEHAGPIAVALARELAG